MTKENLWRYVIVSDSELRRARIPVAERLRRAGIDPTQPYEQERTANGDHRFWQRATGLDATKEPA